MTKKGTTNASPTTALAAQTSTADSAAQTSTAQAGTAATGAGAGAGAVVSAEAAGAAPTSAAPDEHHGRGGHYVRVNGVRKLVHRTQSEEEAAGANAAKTADDKGADDAEAVPA